MARIDPLADIKDTVACNKIRNYLTKAEMQKYLTIPPNNYLKYFYCHQDTPFRIFPHTQKFPEILLFSQRAFPVWQCDFRANVFRLKIKTYSSV